MFKVSRIQSSLMTVWLCTSSASKAFLQSLLAALWSSSTLISRVLHPTSMME